MTLKDTMCTNSERVIILYRCVYAYIFIYVFIYKTDLFIVIYSWTYTSPVEEIHST